VEFLNPESIVAQIGIQPGMSVADFGSGSGHLAILMAQKIGKEGRLYAVDILEDKLDSVRVRAKAAGLENIETIRANLEVLGSSGLADGSQDMVILINILFQSEKKQDIFAESKRVLKNGGRIVIIDWKKGAGALPAGRQGLGPPDNLRTDEPTMQSILSSAGFSFERNFDTSPFHYGQIFTKPA